MATSSKETGIRLVVWMAVGQVIYFSYGFWHSKLRLSRRSNSVAVIDKFVAPFESQTKQSAENENLTEMSIFNVEKQNNI